MKQRKIVLLCAALAWGSAQSVHAVESGDTMPDCALSVMHDATRFNLKQYAGNVLYVDFWASWCGPCAKSFPFLNGLSHEFNGRGLQIIGVNLDEEPGEAAAFLAKYPADFQVAQSANQQCAADFGVKAMPSSYLIDRKGQVRHVHLGFRPDDAEQLKALVVKLLTER